MELDMEADVTLSVMSQKEVKEFLEAQKPKKPIPWRYAESQVLDGTGKAIWTVGPSIPTGQIVKLSRVILWADGFSPINPYTNAAGWNAIYKNKSVNIASLWDFFPYSPGAAAVLFPTLAEYSSQNILHFEQNDQVSISIVGGPANGNVTAIVSGYMEEAV